MTPSRQDRFKLAEEAALWVVRLEQDALAHSRGEFFEWVRQSPRHMEEFMFARAVSTQLGRMDPDRKIEIDETALASLGDEPVSDLVKASRRDPASSSSPLSRRARWRWAAGMAATVAVALLAWTLADFPAREDRTYATRTGDQQSVKLRDGSLMQLNAHSRAEVDFSRTDRLVRLLEGEALFVVAQDRTRPFRVVAGTAVIQAIGTQFNVYRRPEGTRVSVVEGVVQISRPAGAGPEQPLRLEAGSEADITVDRVAKQGTPDIERAVAWRARRLVFHGDRLDAVVREFNRYNRAPIRLDDASIADRQISGVFDADDPQPLIEFLTRQPGFDVERTEREVVIRARK